MSAIGTNSVSGAALSSMRAKASDAVASLAGVFPTQHIPNSHGHAYSVNLAQTQPGAQTTYHMAPAQHQAHPNQHHLTVQHQHQASQHQQNVAQQQQQVAADHFFQQLQQTATAAAALPNVLSPYDHHNQSPYIGQLMYFPYPSAAAAANSLFTNSPSTTEHQVHQQSQTISAVANSAALSAVTSQATVVVAPASATLHQHQQNGMAPAGSAVSAATLAPLLTSAANLYPQHTNVNTNCTQSSLQPQGQTSNIQPQQISVQSVTSSGNAITTLASSIGASLGGTTLCTNSILNASAATIADLDKLLPAVPKLEATTAVLSSDGGPLNGGQLITPPAKRDNNGTGQFICGVCGREFGMRCRLIAHTRRHTGERPFPCVECGRAFSDRGNLQRHRYTHSSNPRFHCNVCGKAFRQVGWILLRLIFSLIYNFQASCLSNHRRFHCAGASGRPCPFCARSFRSSSSLQMHIRWKHRADAAAAIAAATAVAVIGGAGATGASVDSNVGIRINGSSLISGNENVLGGGITSGNIGMSIGVYHNQLGLIFI
ncbi:unnamed protein product [Protopolystoma xenopodis]|uniref:C2H2-type domain-containing protein n=1 Tax=Protopolystoma xenopodis TaxID=117903 RepID=A0A448WE12_9PLAT|nr:unnamed protein product [Protopolystoma xenopodis]